MSIENWDEFRTAYHVAKSGTVSGAAQALGVHHATVIRHIDTLEERLGVKLFQRHARGYTPTEAGQDVLTVAQATNDQLAQLVSRIKGKGDEVSGEMVLTTVPSVSRYLMPAISAFQKRHPNLIIRHLSDSRVYRLEYGEAHVAIRAGQASQELDNVVQPFKALEFGLYAHKDYLAQFDGLTGAALFDQLLFIGEDDLKSRAPFYRWLYDRVDPQRVVFRATEVDALLSAVLAGVGAGFVMLEDARKHPELVEVMPHDPDWNVQLWLVTHVDLHRTAKVQAFLSFLKDFAKDD